MKTNEKKTGVLKERMTKNEGRENGKERRKE